MLAVAAVIDDLTLAASKRPITMRDSMAFIIRARRLRAYFYLSLKTNCSTEIFL
jgi:hypothetical protein